MAARFGGRANRRRGEVEAEIDGERRILCLTLGALAELETAFCADDLSGLAARFADGRLKAADLIRILGAGLRGGGNVFSDEEVAAVSIDGGVLGFATVVGELLAATFSGPGGDAAAGGGGAAGGAAGAAGVKNAFGAPDMAGTAVAADPLMPQRAGGM